MAKWLERYRAGRIIFPKAYTTSEQMSELITRRDLVRGALVTAAAIPFPALLRAAAGIPMMVYKDPSCGCCTKWVGLMRSAGFEVSTRDTGDMAAIKTRYKVPAALGSCHTALVGGYVIEGHVPGDLITRLIKEKPKVIGLAVPGMPVGSPGMEGGTKEAFDVVTFDAAGKTTVFARR